MVFCRSSVDIWLPSSSVIHTEMFSQLSEIVIRYFFTHNTVFVRSKDSEFLRNSLWPSGSGTPPFEELNRVSMTGRVGITRSYMTRT